MPEITAELVHELVREQHPDLAGRPVRLGARGWANQLWRLGDDLAVRLPWNADEPELLLLEHVWLPTLAPRLPLPIPVPQRLGRPSGLFPHPWIITTWVPGTPADRAPITRGPESADALGAFLSALHQRAPDDAPVGRDRGGPLSERAAGFESGVAFTGGRGLIDDPDALRAVWRDAITAPPWAGPPVWIHADLHPANVLTADGALNGIVDFGDMCAGDPAYDLSAAWLLLPDEAAVERFHTAYEADDATRRRARGWAMARVLSGLIIGNDNGPGGKPSWAPPARAALHRLLATQA